jgi:hypothetical protein
MMTDLEIFIFRTQERIVNAEDSRSANYYRDVLSFLQELKDRREDEVEPFAWLYENKSGTRILHVLQDCDPTQLRVDMETAEMFPTGHSVKQLFTKK